MPRDLSSAQSGHINWDQVNSSPTQKPGINGSTADLLHLVDYCCVPIGLQKASLAPMIMLIACVKYLCVNSGAIWIQCFTPLGTGGVRISVVLW